jgi:glutathione S-transferase
VQSFPSRRRLRIGAVQAFNSYLCSTVHVAHAHRVRGYRWVDADDTTAIVAMQKKVPQSVAECFDLIEREMFARRG